MLDKSSRPFLYANGFLLFTITFMPFPTALLAEYITTDFAKPAIAFYCFGGVINSLGWNLLIQTLYKPKKLIRSEINLKLVYKFKLSTRYGFLIYLITTVIAFWLPIVALTINLLLWLLWISLSIMEKTTE